MSVVRRFIHSTGQVFASAGNYECAALSVLMATCAFLSFPSGADETGWQPVKETAGIEVQQKAIKNSPFKATRGTMLSDARMFDVLAVLKDVEPCAQWLHKCTFGKTVAKMSESEYVYYTVIDSPFFFKDRDSYVRSAVTYNRDQESLYIQMDGVEDTAPPTKKRVRVLDFTGYWKIEQHNDEQIRLVYEIHMDPQVSAARAANSTMATSVLETLRNVDRLAQSSPYLNSDIPTGVNTLNPPSVHP